MLSQCVKEMPRILHIMSKNIANKSERKDIANKSESKHVLSVKALDQLKAVVSAACAEVEDAAKALTDTCAEVEDAAKALDNQFAAGQA